jgi:hypothetical protein
MSAAILALQQSSLMAPYPTVSTENIKQIMCHKADRVGRRVIWNGAFAIQYVFSYRFRNSRRLAYHAF